jgi:hypothetical protein
MTLFDALERVLNLAEQNKIQDAETPELEEQQKKQEQAIKIVNDFWENHAEEFGSVVKLEGTE